MRTIAEVFQIASPNFSPLEFIPCFLLGVATPIAQFFRRLNAHELKERIDLAEFARRYTRLRRSGRQLVGLCPIHSERHPSFYVHPERRIWFCFGCNRGGDLFDFVMSVECCDFRRALEITAEFSERVARASESRSGSRFGASEGAKPSARRRRAVFIARQVETRSPEFSAS